MNDGARATHTDPLIGRVLDGRYRLVSPIADGGMGRVYLAEQQALDRTVAIKVLRVDEDSGSLDNFRARFFREAKLSSRLSHPNTVRVYDYGKTDDDIYYIVMEYIRGSTLNAILKLEGPMDPLRAIGLALQLCGSLAEAHALGVIHRDLKPDNLMISRQADGQESLRVLDFGIARPLLDNDLPTQSGLLYGSPGYMSPEQILGHELTVRSDLYSVGAILFRTLTGRRPFTQEKSTLLLAQHLHSEPPTFSDINPRLTLPQSLEWVVRQCLKKDPAERFSSVAELAWALRICSMELRGMSTPVPMALRDGRVILPPEVESGLRRLDGGDATIASSAQSSRILTPVGLPAPRRTPPVVIALATALAICVAFGASAWWSVVYLAPPADPPLSEAPDATRMASPEPPLTSESPQPAPPAPVAVAPAPVPVPQAEPPRPAPAPRTPQPRERAPQPEPAPQPQPQVAAVLPPEPAPQPAPAAPAPSVEAVSLAVLTFESDPPGATVRLNGVAIGRTPLRGQPVAHGVYELRLENGAQSIVRTIRIGSRGSTSYRWQGDQLLAR
jgi:serine/threonine protein kinase